MQNLVSHTDCAHVRGPKFLGRWHPAPLGWGRGWPRRNTLLLYLCYHTKFLGQQETQLSLTNRATRLEVTKHGSFLLVCYRPSNLKFVPKTQIFRYSTSKMSWPWNPCQR